MIDYWKTNIFDRRQKSPKDHEANHNKYFEM